MSSQGMASFLDQFSNGFNNRYYQSTTGVAAIEWLRDYMQAIADDSNRNDTSCELFQHSWAQPSVICKIQGTLSGLVSGCNFFFFFFFFWQATDPPPMRSSFALPTLTRSTASAR